MEQTVPSTIERQKLLPSGPTGPNWAGERAIPFRSGTLHDVLAGAEQLLIYATEAGICVDSEVSIRILSAKHNPKIWDDPQADKLISAIATLAAKVAPVTAQSLALCRTLARKEIRKYSRIAIAIVVAILLLSIPSTFTNRLATTISSEIDTANALVLELHLQLLSPSARSHSNQLSPSTIDAPSSSLAELQQLAATMRSISDHTSVLRRFVGGAGKAIENCRKHACELPGDLPNSLAAVSNETTKLTPVYQEVRSDAAEARDMVRSYIALSMLILPSLYAALGVCAYLLRLFRREMTNGTFSTQYDISARFFIAIIGGFSVSLFTGFDTPHPSLSPLALGFLVGYAADAFFSFLEGLVASFKKAS